MNKKIKLLLTLFFLHISHLTASQEQQPKEVIYYFSMCVPFVVVAIKENESSNPQIKSDIKALEVKALEVKALEKKALEKKVKDHVEALSKLYGFPKP